MFQKIIGQPHSMRRIYAFSVFATLASLVGVGVGLGPVALLTVVILIALEVTFSFDNAVVNAKILNTMPVFWRRMFMTVGIFIAVFGMRLVLPIAIVALTAHLGLGEVLQLAMTRPDQYAEHLSLAHPTISAFGGMFLLLIFIDFILDEEKDVHWIQVIERPLAKVGQLTQLPVILAIGCLLAVAQIFGGEHKHDVLVAGLFGMFTYLVVHSLAAVFSRKRRQAEKKSGLSHKHLMRAGFFNFLYLEVLDASFSFDGVIGAFAITKMVVLIAIGLGVGAVWVRSMTVHMVRRHALAKYRYLDHGAHYAIGALAFMLLLGIQLEIPEYITGTLGILIIGFSFLSSWRYNSALSRQAT